MYCPYCGAPAQDDHIYCSACGAALHTSQRSSLISSPLPMALARLSSGSGVRLMALAVGSLFAILVIGELVRTVTALVLPLLLIFALLYWVRERRRRYY
jgi:hypothetical protein